MCLNLLFLAKKCQDFRFAGFDSTVVPACQGLPDTLLGKNGKDLGLRNSDIVRVETQTQVYWKRRT